MRMVATRGHREGYTQAYPSALKYPVPSTLTVLLSRVQNKNTPCSHRMNLPVDIMFCMHIRCVSMFSLDLTPEDEVT